MTDKFAVNQRVRDLIAVLGFANNVEGFYKKYLGEGRSERLRTVVKDAHPIKTDFLVEIAEKVAQIDGRKINGHWLLTGEGEIFLDDNTQLLVQTQRELLAEYRKQIDLLTRENNELRQAAPSNHGQ